jgi:DNA-binding CsgD family transcriptional regulator
MTFHVSTLVTDLIEAASAACSPAEIGRAFFATLQPFGARAIYARAIRSATRDDEHIYSRISPPRWEDIYAERRFSEANFLLREVRRRAEPFRWSRIELRTDRERELAGVLADLRLPDGIGAPVHAPGYLGVTSVAFERLHQVAPAERSAIGVAATVLHHRMRSLSPPLAVKGPALSPRERDCLALIADGKSDWEIGELLAIAETTVDTHVRNARRKLGARSRAQAVALSLAAGLI